MVMLMLGILLWAGVIAAVYVAYVLVTTVGAIA